jgi:hypothetical protein
MFSSVEFLLTDLMNLSELSQISMIKLLNSIASILNIKIETFKLYHKVTDKKDILLQILILHE